MKILAATLRSLPIRCLALLAACSCHPADTGARLPDEASAAAAAMASVVRIETPSGGLGSGSAWSDSVILTAWHVVDGGTASVTTLSGETCEVVATVAFPHDDLAWLHIDPKSCDLEPLPRAPRAALLGARVFGLGHPAGLDWTLAQGIVAHPERRMSGSTYVQTDAALNPGMSGGPLVDEHGRLVGVTALLYTRDGLYAGLAFAVHYDVVLRDAKLAGLLK